MVSHGSGYVKGCQCERCETYRARARERARTYRHPDPAARRTYKTGKQREYDARRIAETGQSYYQANRDQVLAKSQASRDAFRAENPLPPRPPKLAPYHRRKRHGGEAEWARMWDTQQGLCYLCKRPLPEDRNGVHVDHDHSCCDPGPKGRDTNSCRYCRRGLTHERCNQIWGLAKEDADLLRTMAAEGERMRDEVQRRIACKPSQETLLDLLGLP